MKVKKASTYISGHCAANSKGGHDRCGHFPLPEGMTCRCRCHLLSGGGEATGNFPSEEAAGDQAEATAAVGNG